MSIVAVRMLMCWSWSAGSMRGPRETVAKALALECMRAAKAQERGCYVFAFSGPQEVAFHTTCAVMCQVSILSWVHVTLQLL